MANEVTLIIGRTLVMASGVVYRLPARRVNLFSTTAIDVSNDVDFNMSATLPGNVSTECAAQYVKCLTLGVIRLTA